MRAGQDAVAFDKADQATDDWSSDDNETFEGPNQAQALH